MTARSSKERLDLLMVEQGLARSQQQAQRLIMAGQVFTDDRLVDKPGTRVPVAAQIRVKDCLPYVSRGGVKLAAALDAFGLNVSGWIAADVGASTGGFTDCLLQRGAARVYAIDVGYGQLAWKLQQDDRVVIMDRTNARRVEKLPESVGLVTIDASFISLKLILPVVTGWLQEDGQIVALIKPQFEASREQVGEGGASEKRRCRPRSSSPYGRVERPRRLGHISESGIDGADPLADHRSSGECRVLGPLGTGQQAGRQSVNPDRKVRGMTRGWCPCLF